MRYLKTILVVLSLLTSINLYAQDDASELILSESDIDQPQQISFNELQNIEVTKGTIELEDLEGRDSDTGLIESYSLTGDGNRFSVSYSGNANIRKLAQINAVEASYGYAWGKNRWIEPFITIASIQFESLSEANQLMGFNEAEMNEATETLMALGAGIVFRTTYIQDFLKYENFFETIAAYAAWAQIREDFRGEDFRGPGIKADWGIHWRFNKYFHIGTKLSYNWFSVKRDEAFLDEPQSRRHLSLSWLSLGAELTIYL